MRKSFTLYPNAGWWFLLFIPLVVGGFYPTYFAVLFKPAPSIVHIHFALMVIWVAVLVLQPFLFKYKKMALHRKIGRFTYLLVPLLLASSFGMIRLSYYRFLNTPENLAAANRQEVLKTAAGFMALPFLYAGLLAFFYTLAIVNKRRSAVHARYMIATSLTLLGPTVDRIIYASTGVIQLGGFFPIEYVAFLLADSILLFLLWKDYQTGRPVKTLLACLVTYGVAQLAYILFQSSDLWANIVTFLMQAKA